MFRKQFSEVEDACALAQAMVDAVRQPLIVLDKDLRVVAAIWMREGPATRGVPVLAGGSGEADGVRMHWEVAGIAILFGGASIFFGIVPQPLYELVHHAGGALTGIF